MKCLNAIEIYPRVVVYCDLELDKVDSAGKPCHDGKCEPPHPMTSRLAVYWQKREEEERAKTEKMA